MVVLRIGFVPTVERVTAYVPAARFTDTKLFRVVNVCPPTLIVWLSPFVVNTKLTDVPLVVLN